MFLFFPVAVYDPLGRWLHITLSSRQSIGPLSSLTSPHLTSALTLNSSPPKLSLYSSQKLNQYTKYSSSYSSCTQLYITHRFISSPFPVHLFPAHCLILATQICSPLPFLLAFLLRSGRVGSGR
ncbi:hypothetical protein E2C01_095316 [Portunus trituberculatus]|uniref:Uncharacterized protein n=1 Tax=Portunus trituberculatus TaxID=210409 RepID=A0A5B7JPH6_PORTR|nr:hypothetical protein [Portunus trituberculatus]